MTITLTREEAQQVLETLDYLDVWDNRVGKHKEQAIKTLRAKLSEYPKNKVPPHEFVAAATGKENLIGMPIIWAEWPTKEATGEQQ